MNLKQIDRRLNGVVAEQRAQTTKKGQGEPLSLAHWFAHNYVGFNDAGQCYRSDSTPHPDNREELEAYFTEIITVCNGLRADGVIIWLLDETETAGALRAIEDGILTVNGVNYGDGRLACHQIDLDYKNLAVRNNYAPRLAGERFRIKRHTHAAIEAYCKQTSRAFPATIEGIRRIFYEFERGG